MNYGRADSVPVNPRRRRRRDSGRGPLGGRVAGVISTLLIIGGAVIIVIAIRPHQHAPRPSPAAAGTLGPASTPGGARSPGSTGPSLPRSEPVAIDIPAIGVDSRLLHLGLNSNGTIQVPPLYAQPSEAAWYKYSVTPGQIGASVIEGHVDTYQGPSVFFRLGDLRPGNTADITLADGTVAVFRVTGVRQYPKTDFPTELVYGPEDYAALRLITCGGTFDYSTRQYLSSTIVFASLVSWHSPASDGSTAAAVPAALAARRTPPGIGSSAT
jgi:hypothetical protein